MDVRSPEKYYSLFQPRNCCFYFEGRRLERKFRGNLGTLAKFLNYMLTKSLGNIFGQDSDANWLRVRVPEKQARAAEAAAGGSGAVQPCGPAVPGGCGGGAGALGGAGAGWGRGGVVGSSVGRNLLV